MSTYTSASESATAMKGNDSPISIFSSLGGSRIELF